MSKQLHNAYIDLYWETQMVIQNQIKQNNSLLNSRLVQDQDCSDILQELAQLNKDLNILSVMTVTNSHPILIPTDLHTITEISNKTYNKCIVPFDEIDTFNDLMNSVELDNVLDENGGTYREQIDRHPLLYPINDTSSDTVDTEEDDEYDFDDVVVPLPNEIVDKIDKKYYTRDLKLESCVICINDYDFKDIVIQLPCCSKTFHETCLKQWFEKSVKCPLCRSDIRTHF